MSISGAGEDFIEENGEIKMEVWKMGLSALAFPVTRFSGKMENQFSLYTVQRLQCTKKSLKSQGRDQER